MNNILEFKHYLIAGVITYTLTDLANCIKDFSFQYEMIIYCIIYTIITFLICKIKTSNKLNSEDNKLK